MTSNPSLFSTELFPELQKGPQSHTTGVLPSQDLRALTMNGRISAAEPISDDQVQPASFDLRLSRVGFRVRASFLPGKGATVGSKIRDLMMQEIDLEGGAVLERGCVYIVPLMEELNLPSELSGKANPKSTTGRLDVFTRLLTDSSTEFDRVSAGYRGKLYAEIVPRTFSILVRKGTKLSQLRLVRGGPPPSDALLDKLHAKETLVYLPNDDRGDALIEKGLRIAVDLVGDNGSDIVAYRARSHAPLIDLAKVGFYDPADFWEAIRRPKSSGLILSPDEFYILGSKERIRVPTNFAAAMVPYDPSVGEFRIHYAGFFDPGFGYGSDDIKGTKAVLEVRSHEAPFLLEDGQVVGRVIYERLLATPDKSYGKGIGSSYQSQGLALSKQFKGIV